MAQRKVFCKQKISHFIDVKRLTALANKLQYACKCGGVLMKGS